MIFLFYYLICFLNSVMFSVPTLVISSAMNIVLTRAGVAVGGGNLVSLINVVNAALGPTMVTPTRVKIIAPTPVNVMASDSGASR